jgi:hypothetical protein
MKNIKNKLKNNQTKDLNEIQKSFENVDKSQPNTLQKAATIHEGKSDSNLQKFNDDMDLMNQMDEQKDNALEPDESVMNIVLQNFDQNKKEGAKQLIETLQRDDMGLQSIESRSRKESLLTTKK